LTWFVQEMTQLPRAMKSPSRNIPIRTVMTAATLVERFAAIDRKASEKKSFARTPAYP
jgi:hypothetical protein